MSPKLLETSVNSSKAPQSRSAFRCISLARRRYVEELDQATRGILEPICSIPDIRQPLGAVGDQPIDLFLGTFRGFVRKSKCCLWDL